MTFKPNLIFFDYEANGLLCYKDDFVVTSASFAWRNSKGEITTRFIEGQESVGKMLKRCEGIPLCCHNFAYEKQVSKCIYPDIRVDIKYDIMRMLQAADSGYITEPDRPYPQQEGLGLTAGVTRWLPPEYHNHKDEAYNWIRENIPNVKESDIGRHLSLLPKDILERYNNHDAIVTLLLFEVLSDHFNKIEYNWLTDHKLYLSSADMIVDAQIKGVKINREKLKNSIIYFSKKIKEMFEEFNKVYEKEIKELENDKQSSWIHKVKTEKHQNIRREKLKTGNLTDKEKKLVFFNPNSSKDLKTLFVDKLGIKPTFKTKPNPKTGSKGGNPSFAAAHMKTWGEGGKILEKKGSINFALGQAKNLLELSAYDSRWHLSLHIAGTKSGRFTGRDSSRN